MTIFLFDIIIRNVFEVSDKQGGMIVSLYGTKMKGKETPAVLLLLMMMML